MKLRNAGFITYIPAFTRWETCSILGFSMNFTILLPPSSDQSWKVLQQRKRYPLSRHTCLPKFDSDPILAGILDSEKGGHFIISPNDTSDLRVYQNYR